MNLICFFLQLIFVSIIGVVVADNKKKKKVKDLGNVQENELLHEMYVVLPNKNQPELDQLLIDLYNPKSSSFGKFLDYDTFNTHFGPDDNQVQQVVSFLRNQGLEKIRLSKSKRLIYFQGKAGKVNQAFKVHLKRFAHEDTGKEFIKSVLKETLPQGCMGVLGLDNSTQLVRSSSSSLSKVEKQTLLRQLTSPGYYGSNDIRKAYQIPIDATGAGQVIASIQFDTYSMSDIDTYKAQYGLTVPVENLRLSGAPTVPGGGAAEVCLDVELQMAMAPEASKLLVVISKNNAFLLPTILNLILQDGRAKQVSDSWGIDESCCGTQLNSLFNTEHSYFQQFAAQGISFFSASGDSGSPQVIDPATQPFQTAVGGTSLYLNSDGSYKNEDVWYWGNRVGSGGGISNYWEIPSYQIGAAGVGSGASTTKRNIPDVALNSDPGTGYFIRSGGLWYTGFGGTSAAAPLWAAFAALMNQRRLANGKGYWGFVNPSLYTLGKGEQYNQVFHDVATGKSSGSFNAVNGYDLCTGWGSFIGNNMLDIIGGPFVISTKSPTRAPTISPTSTKPTTSPKISFPSKSPTISPTRSKPTISPSKSYPTYTPTKSPNMSKSPSLSPTTLQILVAKIPTTSPSETSSFATPSKVPSKTPSSSKPSKSPTLSKPTQAPRTTSPSDRPTKLTWIPSNFPSSALPSKSPSMDKPTNSPSKLSSQPTTMSSPSKAPVVIKRNNAHKKRRKRRVGG